MDRIAMQNQIDKNRDLINKALHSDLDITLLNIIVRGLAHSNEVLIEALKQ
jgi:hypothetical protein